MSAAKHTPNTTALGLCEFWAKRIEDSTAGTWQRDDARAGMHGAIVAATKERGDLLAALEDIHAHLSGGANLHPGSLIFAEDAPAVTVIGKLLARARGQS